MTHPLVPDDSAPRSDADEYAWFQLDHMRGCAVVVASGEIDLYTSPGLREVLQQAGRAADRVIVDLGGVTFLDSTGMAVIMEAFQG